MVKIVVCDDVDGAFQKSGELFRLNSFADLKIYGEAASNREELLKRLSAAKVAVTIRDRTALDRQILTLLPELRLIKIISPIAGAMLFVPVLNN